MTTNQRIASTRRAAGISQGRLAKRAGFSQSLLCQFEIGNASLRPHQLAVLESALRLEMAINAEQIQRLIVGSAATAV